MMIWIIIGTIFCWNQAPGRWGWHALWYGPLRIRAVSVGVGMGWVLSGGVSATPQLQPTDKWHADPLPCSTCLSAFQALLFCALSVCLSAWLAASVPDSFACLFPLPASLSVSLFVCLLVVSLSLSLSLSPFSAEEITPHYLQTVQICSRSG